MTAKRVLIVEDNDLNMKLFHDLLEAHGYDTLQTKDGMEALQLARQHRPDLILMDIQLPEVSGLEVTKWIKEDDELKAIPIIAVTAFAMKGDEEKIREGGCEAYIAKPISVANFLQTVERFLRLRRNACRHASSSSTMSKSMCKLLEAKLSSEYFNVLTANDGPHGAAAARRPSMPDIILLDVMMPRMDGFEVCRRLKADPAHRRYPGRDGDGAVRAVRPRARPRSRRRRFPDQAGQRHRALRARALARPPEPHDGGVAAARRHLRPLRSLIERSKRAARIRGPARILLWEENAFAADAHRRDARAARRASVVRPTAPEDARATCDPTIDLVILSTVGQGRRAAPRLAAARQRAEPPRADPADRRSATSCRGSPRASISAPPTISCARSTATS